MKCPVCAVDLYMTDRQGVEVDFCPQCRGVWLDRGELDKIIERLGPAPARREYRDHERERDSEDRRPPRPIPPQETDYAYEPVGDYGAKPHRKKKKFRNFLDEILDFD